MEDWKLVNLKEEQNSQDVEIEKKSSVPNRVIVVVLLWIVLIVCYVQRVALSLAIIPLAKITKWEADTEGLVLSSFYWGYILMQIPGGWFTSKVGGKVVMLVSLIGSSFFTLIFPFGSSHLALLLVCRVLTGIFEGTIYPVTYTFLGTWFPEAEKGTASGLIGTAAPIGIIVAFLASPYIIEYLGWESVFFISGGLGLVVSLPWFLLIRNSPDDKNSMSLLCSSESETRLLLAEKSTPASPSLVAGPTSSATPWIPIFKSTAVQSFAFSLFSYNWIKYITISWVPIFLSKSLGYQLESTGIISLLPYLISSILTFISGKAADLLISRGYLKTVTTRKIFQFLGIVFPVIGLIVMSVVQLDASQTVAVMIVAVGATGFTGGGFVPNPLDLSSKYSGIIYAYGNTLGNLPGFLGVYITGEILRASSNNWAIVWLIAAAINVLGLLICLVFFEGEEIDFENKL